MAGDIMLTKLHVQEKIKNIFFEATTNLLTCSSNELFANVAKELQSLLDIANVEIYLYNSWNQSYESVAGHSEGMNLSQEYIDRQAETIESAGTDIICQQRDGQHLLFMPLKPESSPKGLLVLASKYGREPTDENVFILIRQGIEQILQIVNDYRNMKSSDRKNKFLFELTSRLSSSNDKTEMLTEIITSIQSFYPKLSYYLLLSQDYEVDSSLPVKTIEYSDDVTKRVSGQAFISGEVQLENRLKDKAACLYAPLVGKQGVYGVLQIIAPNAVIFPEVEIDFFTQFANAAGNAIETTSLYQNSNRLVTDLKWINDTTHKLNSNLQLSEITKIVRNQIMNSSHATQVGFIHYNQASKHHYDILSGSTAYFNTEEGQALSHYLHTKLFHTYEPLFSGDFKSTIKTPFRSIMGIPMHHAGVAHGLIIIMHEDRYFFTFDMFKLMQSLIQHSTLALANTILKEELEKAVITDYLTKLYSRNYLDEKINQHMESGEMGTLVLFDIDDFKSINDTYGHHIGDEVIVQVAKLLLNNVTDKDIAARWGGEELALYLPSTTMERGAFLARLISKQVEKLTEPRVTLSAGVSSWTNKVEDSVRYFFIRADQALYEAKNIGKNCVVKFTSKNEENSG